MNFVPGGITASTGFSASGICCGIKKKGEPDLALISADKPCAAAGLFTSNRVKAHPVIDAVEKLETGNAVQAIIINSGSANACTGPEGMNDLEKIVTGLSSVTGIPEESVLMASTGVIGERLPLDRITASLPELVSSLSIEGHEKAAKAIMTTDTRHKECAVTIDTSKGKITIGGMAKGAGMINPDMATMLAFITTDALITDNGILKGVLKGAVDLSFNRLDLDIDTSTNDSVIILAGGGSGINPVNNCLDVFRQALEAVCVKLSKMIAVDMEGSTKLINVVVKGAENDRQAEKAARAVAESPLVKTAIHGEDPNWGRIMAAIGHSGAEFDPEDVSIVIGDLRIVTKGIRDAAATEEEIIKKLSHSEIELVVDLNRGSGNFNVWTGDLTSEYIRINASYRS